jgi:polyprenyldihydroxybenzoate methyltransferase/3-demethylubiquinol 3-O-methyltransferase
MNPLRHDFIKACLRSSESPPPQTLSYLDIGCGGGIFASSAARLTNTSTVTAIDPTELVIQVAQAQQRSDPGISPPKLKYLNCAIEDVPVLQSESEKVDIISLFEVLEHIDNPNSFLDIATLHLKKGGWIVGSTISRSPLAYVTTKLIAEAPFIGIVPPGTHDWNKYINPAQLQRYFSITEPGVWGSFKTQGVIYVPALGWKLVKNSETFGNYFFGIQKLT